MAINPGLSYTGQADAPSAADDDNVQDIGSSTGAGAGALVEFGKTKGMNVSGKVPLGAADTAEMLQRMQALLDERSSPMNTFLGGLQRASAWGSGGTQGPSAALTAMDRQRQLEQADTLAMQQNMAALKAQQAARQNSLAGLGLPGYGTQPQGQAGTQPSKAAEKIEQAAQAETDREAVSSVLIDTEDDLEIEVGDVVRYVELTQPNDVLTVQITQGKDDFANGVVNENRPLAQALLGAVVGDEVLLHLEHSQ